MDSPPTIEQLVGCKPPVTGLDERYLVKLFHGKNQAGAVREYRKRGSYLTEDFAYMAADGLRYYLPPALDYLREGPDGDYDFCHGLMWSCRSSSHSFQEGYEQADEIAPGARASFARRLTSMA